MVKRLEDDPLWYKDAIIYEVHIKSYFDSNNDGIGDFNGLIKKLDYLEDLGITAIWLLPFYSSPLKDDGYDISNYFKINPDYGKLSDFKRLIREAHRRGIRVITELVLNHTSDQHPWFQKSRRSNHGTIWRNFYVWSDTPEKYRDARIIFQDFETSNWAWDPVAKAYYWHRFYSHQPDLNYDNPRVHEEMFRVIDFWLSMGVDGLRLDAVPYLYQREGTNCENLPETHEFLKKLRTRVDSKYKNKMLLAEANQWPEDAVSYFGNGDESNMAFYFPLMPRMFMAIQMEDRFPIMDILEQTPEIPENCQWVLFLRNHDELTLEMVTDEVRDYMYRVYTQDPRMRINLGIRRRLAPLLGNDGRKVRLMSALLFTFPGTPVIYYGDEIGMGDNYYLGDRGGVRTPMQWTPDRNAGFSMANPQKLYLPVVIDPIFHYEAVNVENEEKNPSSRLWWMKYLIAVRKKFRALSRGNIEFVYTTNKKILAFTRNYEDETILMVANLSRQPQPVELNLSKHIGRFPVELFSRNRFPRIGGNHYFLTLNPYNFYVFSLEEHKESGIEEQEPPLIEVTDWKRLLISRDVEKLERILPQYLENRRWFGGKAKVIQSTSIIENIAFDESRILIIEVQYTEGLPERYQLPVSFVSLPGDKAEKIKERPESIIAYLSTQEGEGMLIDSVYDEQFRQELLLNISERKRAKGKEGTLISYPGKNFRKFLSGKKLPLESKVSQAEQSNTSILYEDIFFMKLFRRLDEGINPDLEIGRFLTEDAGFKYSPSFTGAIEYLSKTGSEPIVLGMLQRYIPNEGDAFQHMINALSQYFEQVLARLAELEEWKFTLPESILDVESSSIPPLLHDLIGGVYLEMVSLLGKRTGDMHVALSSSTKKDFKPEQFSILYQRSLYQSMRVMVRRTIQSLEQEKKNLSEDVKEEAVDQIVSLESKIIDHLKKILAKKLPAMKIRIHGDYHLGQILYTGDDFVIFDFEGEPARALSERRLKHSPLRDVAGMIRSFHYAASSALYRHIRTEDIPTLEKWADLWYYYMSGTFLQAYLESVKGTSLVPEERDDLEVLLKAFLLEKAAYEINYELNNRPGWVTIPIKGIRFIMGE